MHPSVQGVRPELVYTTSAVAFDNALVLIEEPVHLWNRKDGPAALSGMGRIGNVDTLNRFEQPESRQGPVAFHRT